MALILVKITTKMKRMYSCENRTENYCRNQMTFEAQKANNYKNRMTKRQAALDFQKG